MVAAEIPASNPACASSTSISSSARNRGTRTGMNGARIFPAGARNSVQHRTRAGSRSSPYTRARGLRGTTALSTSASRNAARA